MLHRVNLHSAGVAIDSMANGGKVVHPPGFEPGTNGLEIIRNTAYPV